MKKFEEVIKSIEKVDEDLLARAKRRIDGLNKPVGSLGMVEDLAARLVAIQKTKFPDTSKKTMFVMGGDHGIVEENVAMTTKETTRIQCINMTKGLTGVCAFVKAAGADLKVVDVGIDYDDLPIEIVNKKVKMGTDNFTKGPAMTRNEAIQALEAGIHVTIEAYENGSRVFGTGEMGIGNTTPSSAILSVLSGLDPDEVTGIGANLPQERVKHKANVVRKGIEINQPNPEDPIDVLSKVGGLEIAGMAGVMIGGAYVGAPVIVDGFISTVSALVACRIEPKVREYLIPSHASMEKGARIASELLEFQPPLNLGLRLGEGTGASVMFHVLDVAANMNNDMVSFEEAGFDKL